MSEWRYRRKGMALAIAVAAVMVASALVAFAPFNPASPAASTPSTAAGSLAAIPAASGPETQVTGASNLNPGGPTVLGTISVLPEPAKFNPNAPMSVVITLKPTANLANVVGALSNPASSQYRHYLSAAGVGANFGVSSGQYASAVQYFQGFGLKVSPSTTLLSLSLSGTVAQMESAFHTRLAAFAQQYTSNGVWNPLFGNSSATSGVVVTGPVFYSNTQPASLPQSVAGIVNGIAGLDAMPAQPDIMMPYGMSPNSAGPAAPNTAVNTTVPSDAFSCTTFFFPEGCEAQINAGVNYTQGNFLWTTCDAVGFTGQCGNYQFLFPSTMPYINGAAQTLWNGASTIMSEPDQGQGITIAVVEVGCAIPEDLATFSAATFGNPNQLLDRLTQIGLNDPTGFNSNSNLEGCIFNGLDWGWTLETELDIEYAATMAPRAHIDVVATASADFSSFDLAYSVIAQYLSTMSTCAIPSSAAVILEGSPAGACSISITSNSYGSGEQYQYFYGSPIYMTSTDTLLEELNLIGVTNFFASGDSGGTYLTVNDFASASSPGSTSVGGGEVTAAGPGGEQFPYTSNSFTFCYGFEIDSFCDGTAGTAYFAPATGLSSFTYWDYSEGIGGTYTGITGGGFGQSLAEPQEWWQNGLDTYSSGARIDPVVSESAAFNMTVYAEGTWNFFYGGTSFATPITAGEWALIEEQANTVLGNPKQGDINPLLFAAHNGYQAGVSSLVSNPYAPMQDLGYSFDGGPVNSFTWYYYNLSIENPSAPTQASWFATLYNPAGSGWNYLQGLGMPLEPQLDNALFGQTGIAGHSLGLPAFSILEETGSGLVPFTTLVGGMTYSLEIVPAGVYNVVLYSGGPNDGTYGGGMMTSLQTDASGWFTYTPTAGAAPGGDAATTYGYMLATSVVGGGGAAWSFAPFAVAAPTPSGTLSLCVVDTYGVCQTAMAEVPMFTTQTVGNYNLFGQAQVTLNGLPVPNAEVWQVSVQNQFGVADPTVPPAYYAPGMTIGHTLTDYRGSAQFWPAPLGLAEVNGELDTQIYLLTATYDGLTSNTVTVFVEPQAGSFFTGDLQLVGSGQDGNVVGMLQAAGMKYLDFLNISVGSAPGEYQNWTCPMPGAYAGVNYGFSQPPNTMPFPSAPMTCQPYYDSNPTASYEYPAGVWNPGIWTSGFSNVNVSVNLTTPSSGPVVISVLAGGTNDLSFSESFCEFGECFSFVTPSVQYPMYWQDPAVFLPTHLSASETGTVTGVDTFSFAGTAYGGATGELELVSASGTQVLATGISGSYALDTSTLADGAYQVVYTEVNTDGAIVHSSSVSFYAGNEAATLSNTVSSLEAQLTADGATIAHLQSELNAANANLASLQAQVGTLQSQLSAAQSQIATLNSEIAQLPTTAQLQSLQAQLAKAQANVQSDLATIASLSSQIATLQQELNAKKGSVAPAWYDTGFGGGLVLLFAGLGVAVGVGATYAAMRRRHRPSPSGSERAPAGGTTPPASSLTPPGAGMDPARSPQDVLQRAQMARAQLLREGDVRAAERLGEAMRALGEVSGVPSPPQEFETIYR